MPTQELKLKDIQPGDNYRQHISKAGMKELIASVKVHGVLQPITVRPVGKKFEVVCGHRRHQAAIDAGLKTIDAVVRKLTDEQALEIAVIENSQREDPNPMDEAIGFNRLLNLGKHTVDSLAKKLGKGTGYVYSRLRLLGLAKDAQKALLDGKIDLGHALVLLRLPEKKDQSELLESIIQEDMSAAQARQHLDEYGIDLARALFDTAACLNCERRSSTQAMLFQDGKPDTDQCMDIKCYKRLTLQRLELMARDENAKGRQIAHNVDLRGKKGAIIHEEARIKANKCRECKDLVFFYYDGGPRYFYAWHCPSKRCHDELFFGIKPQPRQQKTKAERPEDPQQGAPAIDTQPCPPWFNPDEYLRLEAEAHEDEAFIDWVKKSTDPHDEVARWPEGMFFAHAAWKAGREHERERSEA